MNAVPEMCEIDANKQALSAELAWLRRLLESTVDEPDTVAAYSGATAPALDFLCERFDLSAFERAVILLCAAVELDSDFARLCAAAQGDARRDHPTWGLALSVLPDAHWSALSPQSPLRYWRMLETTDTSRLTASRIVLDERILHFLLGVAALDSRLTGLVSPLAPHFPLPASQQREAERVMLWWREAQGALPLIGLRGDPDSAWGVALHICASLGLRPLALRAEDLPAGTEERTEAATRLTRECQLLQGAVIIDAREPLPTQSAAFLERLSCPTIVLGALPVALRGPAAEIEVRKPLAEEQRALWRSALGPLERDAEEELLPLAAHFDFSAADIGAAAREARTAALSGAPLGQVLWRAARARSRGTAGRLGQRIEPRATWADLVLPGAQLELLKAMARQVRHRATVHEQWGFDAKSASGLGISALFAGESGTGKTMAAEVLAGDLGMDLYRIDLSAVVSKYIGETEKNLDRLFTAAETSGAVLLFDEADALFGKRTEVRDSHDRYANIETAYLLQRMEAYRGLSILTTNLKSSLDMAFLRRIRFVVQFPFPDLAQRAEIWRRIFPAPLPRAGINVDQLARLHVAGGNIRNIALNAAFLAADEARPLSMEHLARAARQECAKLEKPLSEAELRGWA